MSNLNLKEMAEKSQEQILAEIKQLSAKIIKQRRAAEKGFKTYGGALGLQSLERDRRALQSLLEPLRVVVDNDSCNLDGR